jgi:glycosyltransferase involved in cell wall biosynthesis
MDKIRNNIREVCILNPKVSVIMPVYNAEHYIKTAIDSILEQSYKNIELIIINDCPTDSTMKIVRTYKDDRIYVINNSQNKGIAYSRNAGLYYATGKYIAIMDDDDISLPGRIEKQVKFLEEREDIDILGGKVQAIDENDTIISTDKMVFNNPLYIKVNFLFRCIYHNSEVMFRKKIIDNYGIRYQEKCYGMEDFLFWIECSKVATMSNMDELLLKHRYYNGSETSRVKRDEKGKRKEHFAYLQRFSLGKSGFTLTEEELALLNRLMNEENDYAAHMQEITSAHSIFKKMIHQSKKLNMDFQTELDIYLRQQLMRWIRRCVDIW